jgi:hypothetical protein
MLWRATSKVVAPLRVSWALASVFATSLRCPQDSFTALVYSSLGKRDNDKDNDKDNDREGGSPVLLGSAVSAPPVGFRDPDFNRRTGETAESKRKGTTPNSPARKGNRLRVSYPCYPRYPWFNNLASS